MTACIALRHMYSIASWSPSQSDPLTVSYMCQRQSSSPILPSAAPMPPCAATVWLRVGKTLLMQAVFNPAAVIPHRPPKTGPATPDNNDVVGMMLDRIGGAHLSSPSCLPKSDAAPELTQS